MRIIKFSALALLVYVALIAAFEAFISYSQPDMSGTLQLTTADGDGNPYDRKLGHFELDGVTYLVVNHWPRRWYWNAIENPRIEVTLGGERRAFTAVPVGEAEHRRLLEAFPIPWWGKILTGFPPRRFLRLDPS